MSEQFTSYPDQSLWIHRNTCLVVYILYMIKVKILTRINNFLFSTSDKPLYHRSWHVVIRHVHNVLFKWYMWTFVKMILIFILCRIQLRSNLKFRINLFGALHRWALGLLALLNKPHHLQLLLPLPGVSIVLWQVIKMLWLEHGYIPVTREVVFWGKT